MQHTIFGPKQFPNIKKEKENKIKENFFQDTSHEKIKMLTLLVITSKHSLFVYLYK